MRLSRIAFLTTTLAGSVVSLALIASGCSPKSGDGDGDTGTGTDTSSSTGNPDDGTRKFCVAAATCPPNVAGVDLTAPVVSFDADVYPIFLRACGGGSGCHRDTIATNLQFTNGPADPANPEVHAPLDAAGKQNLYTVLTTQTSDISATARHVVPGDWLNSFLMMKIDGCQNSLGAVCDVPQEKELYFVCQDQYNFDHTTCGAAMPLSDDIMPSVTSPVTYPLSDDDKNTIRRWIAQGAQFN